MKFPYFLALDVDDKEEAFALASELSPWVGGFKVGPRLGFKYGETFISELAKLAPVFVDNKYYDIPSAMEASVRASFLAGASFCTVHGASGATALKLMADLEAELSLIRSFQILAVTVLTSFESTDCPSHWKGGDLVDHVKSLALDVKKSGLKGLVCSAQEAAALRALCPDFFLVTPGVRWMDGDEGDVSRNDQRRVSSPQEALVAGANALVIGRSILRASSPQSTAKKISDLLKSLT